MIDIDDVIKAIETHISTSAFITCDDCTYVNDGWCITRVMSDALTFLKDYNNVDHAKTVLVGNGYRFIRHRNGREELFKR